MIASPFLLIKNVNSYLELCIEKKMEYICINNLKELKCNRTIFLTTR